MKSVKITFLYVGASLPGPIDEARRDINQQFQLDLDVALHNCGDDFPADQASRITQDVLSSDLLFIIHVTNQENANSIGSVLDEEGRKPEARSRAIIAFNCMPELMRRTRMGKLDFAAMMKPKSPAAEESSQKSSIKNLARKLVSLMADSVRKGKPPKTAAARGAGYTRIITRLPAILKFLPAPGKLADIKNYLFLFGYFLQPTPANIRSMLLYAIKHYVPGNRALKVPKPESPPAVGIYHPDAETVFESFDEYQKWYDRTRKLRLDPARTVGLLLMRPQIISNSRAHYDALIHAIEDQGLAVIPAISTLMDNREACGQFFVKQDGSTGPRSSRVSQIVSLTGFSFVGGPAMNDSGAAVEFLKDLNVPLRSMVSLDIQTISSWQESRIGLNPVQTAMQVAIPEIDGATEPFIYGGMPLGGTRPESIADRCTRISRRLGKWNQLRTANRADLKVAFVLFCFPPNKGNVGTAAELDVFPSLWESLDQLHRDGYQVHLPPDAEALREMVLGSDFDEGSARGAIAYRLSTDEYRRISPYVDQVELEWGRAPGQINSNGRELLIPGILLGNAVIVIQPTFGYEGDPMRMLAAESGCPNHAFMALYAYLEKVFQADVVIHFGTHGSLEFMPGKQAGLSEACWPDRLIGELPNIYLYSVNNPSEGTIARRRSYAELISYLTPPIDNAGLYKGLAGLKEMLTAYRQSASEPEREQLFKAIEEQAASLHL